MDCAHTTFGWKPCLLVMVGLLLFGLPLAPAAGQSPEDPWLNVLAADTSVADKCHACRQLQTVGTEKSVPALAALLTEPAISHAARIALEAMPYPAAGAALREALGQTQGLTKVGVIGSLGQRRDAEAVDVLADCLADGDPVVRSAAAAALGKIAGPAAIDALNAAHAAAQGDDRAAVGRALLRCADRCGAAGQQDQAIPIYVKLMQPTESPAIRAAALRGYLRTTGSQQPRRISEALANEDAWARQAAAGCLADLSDPALAEVAAGLTDLPVDSQISVLAAIRLRGARSLAPLVLQAAESAEPAVRQAAVQALGIVGDAVALPLLLDASAAEGPLGAVARESLQIICDPQLDTEIVRRLRGEHDPTRRAKWIALVAARRPAGAVDLLLDQAAGDHPQVRSRAMAALANLAGPQHLAALAAAVLRAEKGAERDEAEKTVMLVSRRVPDAQQQAAAVIALVRRSAAADRAALLPLLGRIGGDQALQEIQSALESGEDALYEAGVRALCNWPDASVSAQLLELADTATSPAHRLWALRAFIRVIALPSDIPDADKLAMLRRAIERAERDDERHLVLQRVSAVRTVEALRFLLPYLDQPALAQAAGASIVELARHDGLRDPHRAEFTPALEHVLETQRDAAVCEQARRFLQAARDTAP
jgi:HEAT repeat protein